MEEDDIKIPMYSMEIMCGYDDKGELCVTSGFFNLQDPEDHVPAFYKIALAGEAQIAAMADTFIYHGEED